MLSLVTCWDQEYVTVIYDFMNQVTSNSNILLFQGNFPTLSAVLLFTTIIPIDTKYFLYFYSYKQAKVSTKFTYVANSARLLKSVWMLVAAIRLAPSEAVTLETISCDCHVIPSSQLSLKYKIIHTNLAWLATNNLI